MTRQRIEEIRDTSLDYGLGVYIPIHELRELCTLALQAMPVVEWVKTDKNLLYDWFSTNCGYFLTITKQPSSWTWHIHDQVLGTADSLEAAKAAAEEALAKLWGGGE